MLAAARTNITSFDGSGTAALATVMEPLPGGLAEVVRQAL
jgi:hypothetical protein